MTFTSAQKIREFLVHVVILLLLGVLFLALGLTVCHLRSPTLLRLACYSVAFIAAFSFWGRQYVRLKPPAILMIGVVLVFLVELAWIPRFVSIPDIQERNQRKLEAEQRGEVVAPLPRSEVEERSAPADRNEIARQNRHSLCNRYTLC